PDDVRRLFRRNVPVGASFGVINVLGPRTDGKTLQVEVATFRSDVHYSDGRHPDEVIFSTPEEDARRRDFTINGMFLDPLSGVVLVGPILPELLPMKGLPQGPPHAPTGDLWDHVLAVLDRLGDGPSFPLALATLLHDVGKPRTVGRGPDHYTFYYHEHVGRRM